MWSPELLQPLLQLSAPLPQFIFLCQQLPLLLSDLHDELRRLLQDHHLRRFFIVGHRWDLVPQNHEAHLQLVSPLPLQHVVSPALVVVLALRFRAPAPAPAALPRCRAAALRLHTFLRGLLGSVVVLVDVDVRAFEDQRGGVGPPRWLSPVHCHHIDLFLFLIVIFLFWEKQGKTFWCKYKWSRSEPKPPSCWWTSEGQKTSESSRARQKTCPPWTPRFHSFQTFTGQWKHFSDVCWHWQYWWIF